MIKSQTQTQPVQQANRMLYAGRRRALQVTLVVVTAGVYQFITVACGQQPNRTSLDQSTTDSMTTEVALSPTNGVSSGQIAQVTTIVSGNTTSVVGNKTMNIRYTRSGGRTPPRDREILDIDATGAFTLWRSVGAATNPPTPIGRFVGQLDAQLNAEVQSEAQAALDAGDVSQTPRPDSPVETITVDGVKARLGAYDEPAGAWGTLVSRLRQLLGDLAAFPQAALTLEVQPDGSRAQLIHQGSEALQLDLSALTVRAVLWESDNKAGDWRAPKASGSPGRLTADPGWTYDLLFDHGFTVASGQDVVAYVTLTVFDGQQAIPVALSSPRTQSG
jgi:hypothetical protein